MKTMIYAIGRCANTKCCSLASAGHELHIRSGDNFVCPQCGVGLAARGATPRGRRPFAAASGIVLAFIAVNAGAFFQGQCMLRGAEFAENGAPISAASAAPAPGSGMADQRPSMFIRAENVLVGWLPEAEALAPPAAERAVMAPDAGGAGVPRQHATRRPASARATGLAHRRARALPPGVDFVVDDIAGEMPSVGSLDDTVI